MARRLTRGDIYLCRFGSPDKRRPAVIVTRDPALGYLTSVTVAPISSTVRGVPSEVVLDEQDGMKNVCAVNLHRIATVTADRLEKRVGSLTPARLEEICRAIRFSLSCES